MSALSSALAVWCVYQSTAILARCALGGTPLEPFGDRRDISVALGAALAALSLGGSYTFWFNAVEAEVYGYSIFFACLGVWLILCWEGTRHGTSNDRWLLLIAYVFGLGAGIHMLCLLTLPTILVLAWFADEKLRRLIRWLMGMAGWALALMWLAAKGDAQGALELLVQYRTQHGQVEQLSKAEKALQNYLGRTRNEAGHSL